MADEVPAEPDTSYILAARSRFQAQRVPMPKAASFVELTRDQIIERIERGARRRMRLSAKELIHAYRHGQLQDSGKVVDLLSLANLLDEEDPLFAPDLPTLLGQVRELTKTSNAGLDPGSFDAFRVLASLLLRTTILKPSGDLTLSYGPRPGRQVAVLGGLNGPEDPLPLNDGRYLRFSIALYMEYTAHGPRAKVKSSGFQYQLDPDGEHWIFRYDYIRQSSDTQPATYLHIRGGFVENCLPASGPCESIRFPTRRISLEAAIRLLIEQFRVPTNQSEEIWRPILANSEAAFLGSTGGSRSAPDA